MIEIITSILKNSLSITFFVLVTMLFIEFFNVKSSGAFNKIIQKSGFRQILLGAILGVLPGCLGAYTMVTFYTHNIVTLGALTAAFVATMGDEAFLLFSISPIKAIIIFAILFVVGIIVGLITDKIFKQKALKTSTSSIEHFHIHNTEHNYRNYKFSNIVHNLKTATPHRIMLLVGIGIILILSITGNIGHSHDFISSFSVTSTADSLHAHHHHDHEINWLAITFVGLSLFSAFVVSVVDVHFLEDHLWGHIIKKHFLKIFLWTTIVLLIVAILKQYIHIEAFIQAHPYELLLLAILIGIIPESGPHVIFLSLFISGTIPASIFIANSLVQNGHAALPLIAESKKTFIKIKIINIIVGLLFGLLGLQFGF